MGVPNPGVLAGYTNGTITTYDYSLDFAAIVTQLTAVNTNLVTMNASLATIALSLSPAGATVPLSMANSAAISKNMLIQLAGGTDSLDNKNSQMSMLIKGLQGSVDALSSAVHEQVAIQTLQAADQIENNAFQKQATLDALARNNLPAPQPPAPLDTIKEKVVSAELIHGEALMTSTVSSITDNVLAKLSNYILTSGPVIWAEDVVSGAWNYVYSGIKNAIQDYLPTTVKKAGNEVQRVASNANIPSPNGTP
jgi:hypothetical protein